MIDRQIDPQGPDQIIDIADWPIHEDFEVFPQGARDKTLRVCPDPAPFQFCLPGHLYLFKEAIKSSKDPTKPRHPDQYWAEIIAYKIGRLMSLQVPLAFVARNSESKEPGIISEWFLGYPGNDEERYSHGGDHMQRMIPGYDRDKGRQHNLETILKFSRSLGQQGVLTHDWREYWALCLCFDALIGNTDRHQENWGVIWTENDKRARFSPYFDNGTSLGHELFPKKMRVMVSNADSLLAYLRKGQHHMKLKKDDVDRMHLVDAVATYCKKLPGMADLLRQRLEKVGGEELKAILEALTKFEIESPFTSERANFVYILTMKRKECLLNALGK